MAANTTTTNYNFNLTDFDKIPWHTEEHNNWHIIDALLARYIAIGSVKGAWENALAVTVESRYIDPDTDTIWEVLVAHTTASTGTFAADRTANSSYWKSISVDVSAKGTYAQNTAYNPNDFVIQGDRYGVVQTTYTSDNTQASAILSYDLDVTNGNIVTLIDGSDLFDIIFSSTGMLAKTATGTFTSREVEGGTGIDLTNGTGISGNPSVAIDSTVATLSGSQVLTNKTLTAPTINGVVGGSQTSATISTLTTSNVDGILGGVSPAAATTANLTVNGNTVLGDATGDSITINGNGVTLANAPSVTGTWANLGGVTTVDINGGTVDGAIIGGASTAAISGTTGSFSGNVTGAAPSSGGHLTTKTYVDGLLAGLAKRGTVRAATTADITIATALNNGDALDGVTLADDNLVLVKNQSDAEENGIYVVGSSPARDDLYDTYDEHCGSIIHVQEGSANADKIFQCTSNAGGTLNTTAIVWSNIVPGSGGTVTQVVAGTGLSGGTITSTGTVALDINSLTTETSIHQTNDFVPFYDANDSAANKVTVANLIGSAAIVQGTHTIWVPASAMTIGVNAPSAAVASIDSGSVNTTIPVLDFDPGSSDEVATFNVAFPKSWNASTVTARFFWTNSDANSGNVVWGLQGVCIVNDAALNSAMSDAGETVQDANITTAGDLMVTSATSAITVNGAADDGVCFFNVFRDASDTTNDTYATDARLVGVQIFYTVDAKDDS
jgi:hypothetical protein